MQWTVRLEARTSQGEVTTTELVTFSRPAVISTLAEVGLVLSNTKVLLAKLQASMLCCQVAPLPPACAHDGGDGLAGPRAAERPLHAGAGAGAGRAERTHLVPGWGAHSGSFAARLAGKP